MKIKAERQKTIFGIRIPWWWIPCEIDIEDDLVGVRVSDCTTLYYILERRKILAMRKVMSKAIKEKILKPLCEKHDIKEVPEITWSSLSDLE